MWFDSLRRTWHLAGRFGAVLLMAGVLSGCDTDLANLIDPSVSSVTVKSPFAGAEGSASDDATYRVNGSYFYNDPNESSPSGTSLSTQSSFWDVDQTELADFEDAIRTALNKDDGPSQLTTCDERFGIYRWEFATHCGTLFDDKNFPRVELTKEQRDFTRKLDGVPGEISIDFVPIDRLTVTFEGAFINPSSVPATLDLALFGIFVTVSDSTQRSFNAFYADGQRPLERIDGTTQIVDGDVSAEYRFTENAPPLARVTTLMSLGRSYNFTNSLTFGDAKKRVTPHAMLKFNTAGVPHPRMIVGVDFDLTVGDITLSTTQ